MEEVARQIQAIPGRAKPAKRKAVDVWDRDLEKASRNQEPVDFA
jgi:hypothetical protein